MRRVTRNNPADRSASRRDEYAKRVSNATRTHARAQKTVTTTTAHSLKLHNIVALLALARDFSAVAMQPKLVGTLFVWCTNVRSQSWRHCRTTVQFRRVLFQPN